MRNEIRSTAAAGAVLAVLLTVTACGAAPSATSTPGTSAVDVVVIGDSIIDPANGCGACAGFAEQYADHVGQVVGARGRAHLVTALAVPDALAAVTDDPEARRLVAGAEVVVVEVGFNNVIPDPETGIGCKGSLDSLIGWIRATRKSCMEEGVRTYGDLYDRIFSTVKGLRKDRPTAYIATTSIDGNNGDPAVDQQGVLAAVPEEDRDEALAWTLDAYVRWNTMLTERATAGGFQVVDLATAVNGADGTAQWFPYTVDGAHPSEEGHAFIAKQLETADLTVLE